MARAAPTTIGESLAHVSRRKQWAAAIAIQILIACITIGAFYDAYKLQPPSFFSSDPWRLSPLLSWGVYMSLLFLLRSYIRLYLPCTPVAIDEKLENIGAWAVGVGIIGLMVSVLLGLQVEDDRVLASCTGVAAMFIVGLVALWVWLSRTYGGGSESSTLLPTIRTTNSSIVQN